MKLLSLDALRAQMKPGEVEVWRDTDDSPYKPEQIDAGIARYNAATPQEAPVVIDHDNPPKDPRTGPQYGRLGTMRRIGAHVVAQLSDLDSRIKDWSKSNLRGRSMEWYTAHNGEEGALFPRALAFIGAQPPAIKGMAPAQFNEPKGVAVVSQPVDDAVLVLDEEDDETMKPKRTETAGGSLPPENVNATQFSESQVAALRQVVGDALKPFASRLDAIEAGRKDEATSAFEARVASFSEQVIKRGIIAPAKLDDELGFVRSLRDSGKAEAYMERRLADEPTVPLGEAKIGKITTFSEGKVLGADGKEHDVLIDPSLTAEQRRELEDNARYARQHKITLGEAQIAREREARGLTV